MVITGASSGVGRVTALRLAKRGDSVVLASRRGAALDLLARECEQLGASALAVATDVSSSAEVERLAAAAVERFGRIDVWVNNASVTSFGSFLDTPLDDIDRVLDVNLRGYIHGARAAFTVFHRQGSGTLVNVSSIIAEIPVPYMTAYSIAKAGVNALSMSLRQEITVHGPKGVHVTTVLPASIDTAIYRNAANVSGHVAMPPPPVYPPEVVATAIESAIRHPRREVVAGPAGLAFVRLHRVLPGIVEGQMAVLVDLVRRFGRPLAPTRGAIEVPASTADATEAGGWHGTARYRTRRVLVWGAALGAAFFILKGRQRPAA